MDQAGVEGWSKVVFPIQKTRNRPTFFSTFLLFYFFGFELRKVLHPSTLEKKHLPGSGFRPR